MAIRIFFKTKYERSLSFSIVLVTYQRWRMSIALCHDLTPTRSKHVPWSYSHVRFCFASGFLRSRFTRHSRWGTCDSQARRTSASAEKRVNRSPSFILVWADFDCGREKVEKYTRDLSSLSPNYKIVREPKNQIPNYKIVREPKNQIYIIHQLTKPGHYGFLDSIDSG